MRQQLPENCRYLINWRLPAFLFLLLLVPAALTAEQESPSKSSLVAKIGQSDITVSDLNYFIAIQSAYGNTGIKEAPALVGLVNVALELEVGRIVGVQVTEAEISAFSEHADTNSQAPEILSMVKEVFCANRKAYERIYLSPKVINQKLRYWYSRNEQIHKQERKCIERAYALARTDKTMEKSAKEIGLEYDTITKAFAAEEVPFALKPYFPEQNKMRSDSMLDIINQLKDGEINTNIIEDDFGYRVIKRLSIDDEGYTFEQMLVRKRPFDQWFGEQATTIRVSILDKDLKEKVSRTYPNLWWVKD